jgi:EAL domain-containing protein (putative c-di-GMP-specific phosphodiesterase class I)
VESPSVLVVDDDPDLLLAISRTLRRHGFRVVTSDGGSQALGRLAEETFAVILTDVQMPGIGGVGLLRELRARELAIPVVLMTGDPQLQAVTSAIEHGAFRFLIKPFPEAELVGVLNEAVEAGPDATLTRALASLEVKFAPIVSARDGTVYGQEVRLRTAEPTLPDLTTLLESAVRRQRLQPSGRALRDFAADAIGSAEGDGCFFLRLHPGELLDPQLYDTGAPLSRYAERVILELTQIGHLQSFAIAPESVARLRAVGFRIAIGELGAGYASLTSLAALDPEFVKLDASLVRNVHQNLVKQQIVSSLTRLGRALGRQTVADGIETQEEREMLVRLGCDLLQGTAFAKR